MNTNQKRNFNNIKTDKIFRYRILSIMLILGFIIIQPTTYLTNKAYGKTTLAKETHKSSFLNSYIPSDYTESEVTALEEGTFESLDFFTKAKQREYYHNDKYEDSVSISFNTQSQWGDSAVCEVKIKNNTSKSVDLSDIAFTVDGKITSIWNASIEEEEPYESFQKSSSNNETSNNDTNDNFSSEKDTKSESNSNSTSELAQDLNSNNYFSYNVKIRKRVFNNRE